MLRRKKSAVVVPERQRLEILYNRYRSEYEDALHKMFRKIRKVLIKTGINFNIKYRLKSFESYFNKIIRLRRDEIDPISMHDLLGLRIIVPFLEDVQAVEDVVEKNFLLLEVDYKGKKNSFREFSYDSVHLSVAVPEHYLKNNLPYVAKCCEIQVRTILQDAWAEVEHELVYKADFSALNDPLKRKLASLNASLTLSDIIFQEIRDYQKTIISKRQKRHERFFSKANKENHSSLISHVAPQQFSDLTDDIKKSADRSKQSVEKQIAAALEAHSNKHYKQAARLYSKILRQKIEPKIRSLIYNHRGMVYFIESDYDQSISDFSQAIKYDEQNVMALNNRGLAYRMTHQFNLALKDFERSLQKNPFQHETYHLRALTYVDIDDLSKALEDCEKTLNIKPDFEAAKHLKEMIRSEIGF